ncbi:MAG TPA: malate synthase A [Bacteroidetes bacterium]|nr:malate synthase A [Bacteroidota bacterium]
MSVFAPVPVRAVPGLTLHAGAVTPAALAVLTPEAGDLLVRLHRALASRRLRLLREREAQQRRWDAGALPGYLPPDVLPESRGDWRVAPLPEDMRQRRVEITGPVSDRKMVIQMLSRTASGQRADAAMLDFEDSMAPTWENVVAGVRNVIGAARGELRYEKRDASGEVIKTYELDPDDQPLTMVRVRGLHLVESNVRVDGEPVSAGLFDLAMTLAHGARPLLARGRTPALYVPKVEHHLEARWWADAFVLAESVLGIQPGTIRATFLIETLSAAFQMEEILYELRDYAAGLNGGRWDKIFSDIKCLQAHADRVTPDRATIGMNRPWMEAYARQLVRVCHRHGALAMGGMAAFTPGRDPETREAQTAKVVQDKEFEAGIGHDGCWVSHPYFIGPALAPFERALNGAPNQLAAGLDAPERPDLLPVGTGPRTLDGLRTNVRVGIAYLRGWRAGIGCVAWDDLMEDLATLEISRAQVHQWRRHAARLDDGTAVTDDLVRRVFAEETDRILADALAAGVGASPADLSRLQSETEAAAAEAERVFLEPEMRSFLTLRSPLADLAPRGDGASREATPTVAAS